MTKERADEQREGKELDHSYRADESKGPSRRCTDNWYNGLARLRIMGPASKDKPATAAIASEMAMAVCRAGVHSMSTA